MPTAVAGVVLNRDRSLAQLTLTTPGAVAVNVTIENTTPVRSVVCGGCALRRGRCYVKKSQHRRTVRSSAIGGLPERAWLTGESTRPDGPGDIAWNFAKFVVGRDGAVKARFNPRVEPGDPVLRDAIDAALAE